MKLIQINHYQPYSIIANEFGHAKQYLVWTSGAKENGWKGFNGESKELESSFMNMGMRIYDPSIGRFLSVDPLFEAFPNQSPYSYALNNPHSFKDPSGLAPEKEKGGKNQIQGFKSAEELINEAMNFQQIEAWANEWKSITNSFLLMLSKASDVADNMVNYIYEINFGSNGGNTDGGGGGGSTGEGSDGRLGKTESNNGSTNPGRDGMQKQVKEKTGNATDEYLNDPDDSTVLDDIP